MNRASRTAAIVAAPVLLIVGLAGGYAWGNSKDNSASSNSTSGGGAQPSARSPTRPAVRPATADVKFAQMMVEHHSHALDMAKLAATRGSSHDVNTLAAKVEAAQQPEIDMMNGWLKSWGADSMSGILFGTSR